MTAPDSIHQGTLRTAEGRVLPLERTDVEVQIAGPVAEVIVRQRFKNDGAVPIEAVYLFPLPHQASVHRMAFRIEDRIVRAVVKEKEAARRAYEQAKSEGRAATLLEEDRPSLFTLSVANIAPGAVIEVELAYQEVVAFDDGDFRFVFPMVAPERYVDRPAPAPGGLLPPRLPSGERPADIGLAVTVHAAAAIGTVRCASHRTETETQADGSLRVRLPPSGPVPNRDFVLVWQASGSGVRPRLHFERKAGEKGTFLLLVTPSAAREEGGGVGQDQLRALRCGNCGGIVTDMTAIRDIPGVGPVVPCKYCGAILAPGTETVTRAMQSRDVVILVDRSSSMRASYAQARRAVLALLSALPAGDGVQIIAFNHDRTALTGDGSGFLALAPEVVAQAEVFLSGLTAHGGSELSLALAQAGKLPPRAGRTRQVVLITDAAVGNEGLLLRKVPELIGTEARLYVLGVGPSIDRRLVAGLARSGGGAHDVLLPDEDVEATLARFARRVREGGPVLRDLGVFWEGSGMVDAHPQRVPDLFGGQPIQMLGRYDGVGATRLVITGRTATDKPYRQEIDVDLPAQSAEVPGLSRLWARRHVEVLAEKHRMEPHRTELRGEAIALSLEHAIVSPFTSLVAEDSAIAVQKIRVKKLVLLVEEGPDAGKSFVVGTPRVRIGRYASCDIVVTDTQVSRVHCELLIEDGTFSFIDVASTNGTWLDGVLARRGKLAPGMQLRLAATSLRVLEHQGDDAWLEVLPTKRVDVEMRSDGEEEGTSAAPPAPARMMMMSPLMAMAARAAPPADSEPRLRAPRRISDSAGGAPPLPAFSIGGPSRPAIPPPGARRPPPAMGAPPLPPPSLSPPSGAPPPPQGGPPPASPSPQVASSGPPQTALEVAGSQPYPEQELRFVQARVRGELDLVFLIDATGSMGSYIQETQQRLLELIEALRRSPLCKSLRIGLVSYRDHPPQEQSYLTEVVPLTDQLDLVQQKVAALSARGGGDAPEAVTDGLFAVVRMDYRPGAAKAVVWFGDAPPHGVEPRDDAFPEGCPCGEHWFAQAESCREMGIAIYAIGCLPQLRHFVAAEAVYRLVARTTRGIFMALREAHLLVPILLGAALSELDRQRIDEHVADLLTAHGNDLALTREEERVRWLTEALRLHGVQARGVPAQGDVTTPRALVFREVVAEDVEGALWRLRALGRCAA